MRTKQTAVRSIPFVRLANHCNFAASVVFLLPIVDLTASEKRFCKENSIVPKTYVEMRGVYLRKGKNGLKHFVKNRKMSSGKTAAMIEFMKGESDR